MSLALQCGAADRAADEYVRARVAEVVPAGQGGCRMRCTGAWAARDTCRAGAGALGCAAMRAKGGAKWGARAPRALAAWVRFAA